MSVGTEPAISRARREESRRNHDLTPPRDKQEYSPLLYLSALALLSLVGLSLILFSLYQTQSELAQMRIAIVSRGGGLPSERKELYKDEQQILERKAGDGSLERAMQLVQPAVSSDGLLERVANSDRLSAEDVNAMDSWLSEYSRLHSRSAAILLTLLLLSILVLIALLSSTYRAFGRLKRRVLASESSVARAVAAQESERLRVSQELHDKAGSALSLALLYLKDDDAPAPMQNAANAVDEALQTIREISSALRPPPPTVAKDLYAAVTELAQRMSTASRIPIETRVVGVKGREYPPFFLLQIYRILQELLTNGIRHADANRLRVTLMSVSPELILTYEDNGRGISRKEIKSPSGSGLLSVRDRLQLLDGTLKIETDEGTRIEVRVPLPKDTEE